MWKITPLFLFKKETGFELTQSGFVPILFKKNCSELKWMWRGKNRLHRNNWIISGELHKYTYERTHTLTHTQAQTLYQKNEKKTEQRKKTSVINYWLTVTFYQITLRCGLTWFWNYFSTSRALFCREKKTHDSFMIHFHSNYLFIYFFLHVSNMTTILWIDSETESKPQNSIEYKTFTVLVDSIVLFFSFLFLFQYIYIYAFVYKHSVRRTTFCIQIKLVYKMIEYRTGWTEPKRLKRNSLLSWWSTVNDRVTNTEQNQLDCIQLM